MAGVNIKASEIKAEARGFCAGGDHPDPPLDKFPLLCWSKFHPQFGSMVVHLEDQKASVHDVALAHAELGSLEAVAAKFGTTLDHADQAARYADAWRKVHAG